MSELGDNISCAHCGYNLRGLSTVGHCPECSYSIHASVEAHILRRVPLTRADLEHLCSTLDRVLAAIVMGIATWILGAVLSEVVDGSAARRLFWVATPVLAVFAVYSVRRFISSGGTLLAWAFVAMVAFRCTTALGEVIAWSHPWLTVSASLLLAATSGVLLRGLSPFARMAGDARLVNRCERAKQVFLVLSGVGCALSFGSFPTLLSARSLPFLANSYIVLTTLWVLWEIRKAMRRAVPSENAVESKVDVAGPAQDYWRPILFVNV